MPPMFAKLTDNQIRSLGHSLAAVGYSSIDVETDLFEGAVIDGIPEILAKYRSQVGFTNEIMELAEELQTIAHFRIT